MLAFLGGNYGAERSALKRLAERRQEMLVAVVEEPIIAIYSSGCRQFVRQQWDQLKQLTAGGTAAGVSGNTNGTAGNELVFYD